MSRATEKLQGQIADLEYEVSELQRTVALHKQTARRLCDSIRENHDKPHGDALTVGHAWAAASYICGDSGPAPWARALVDLPRSSEGMAHVDDNGKLREVENER
jgi:hypothetical protein